MKLRIGFDMSSFMWNQLSGGRDDENGFIVEHEGKKVQINSALYGYDKVMTRMLGVLKQFKCTPINALLVFEGERSKSKRLMIDASYKGGSGRASHAPQAYEQFHILKDMLKQTWLDLGAIALTQDLAEGDDTLGYLADNTEEDLVIATFDGDLAVLNKVNAYGAEVRVWINDQVGLVKGTYLFDHHLLTTYKALVGDNTDNIKGVPGFGAGKPASAFEKFCGQYGLDGLQELHEMLENRNLRPLECMVDDPEHPLVTKIMSHAAEMQRSFDLARIRPEWVDTMDHPLKYEVGMVRQVRRDDDIRFKQWYGRVKLVTAEEFDDYVEWALEKINDGEEVSLDIETSSCDEGDEWLERQRSKSQRGDGVDVFGAKLTSLQITFGDNNQYTAYFPVDHVDTDNVDSEKLRVFVAAIPRRIPIVIQNTAFELVVLFNEWAERQADNGFHGFIPNVLDTKIEGSYVNENMPLGLKERSKYYLEYDQKTYDETVTLTGAPEDLPRGGRLVATNYLYVDQPTGKMVPVSEGSEDLVEEIKRALVEEETGEFELDDKGDPVLKKGKPVPIMRPVVESISRKYRMNELSARQCLAYGADDPITTIALHNFYKLHMQLDHHWKIYKEVEIAPCYQHAKNFIDGVPISLEEMNLQAAEDTKTYNEAWAVLRDYLIKKGWEGVVPPVYSREIAVAQVKEAYEIVTGEKLDTMMRTMSKIITYIREVKEKSVFAAVLERMVDEKTVDPDMVRMHEKAFNDYVQSHFSGEPVFSDNSPKQMCHLLYDVMALPIKVRNPATDIMKKAGIYEGNPKANALALEYGLLDATTDEQRDVLNALKMMSMVGTRRGLYYNTYPNFPHWKDGLVRSQHNQCHANTRRASTSKPNLQQLPKHPKIEGFKSRFRAIIRPHRPDAVVVSIDFDSQEMRIIAEESQDAKMLSMFVGENLTGPHSLTGLAIAIRKMPKFDWSYETFEMIRDTVDHELFNFVKGCRVLGKKLNFVAEYGAMAPKVAETLMITEEEAQLLIDAREEMFPDVKAWKLRLVAEAKRTGKAFTMLGAVRHLRDAFMSEDRFESSKAERQAVNFRVQSSSGEQTKLAEGRMWDRSLFFRYDAVCYGPVHDELIASVLIKDLVDFIPEMHACMTVQYAGMKVPNIGSIAFGPDFFNQIEIGTEPTREAIEKGIAKLAGFKLKEAA